MGEYVDTYTSLLNRLEAMNAPIPGALAVIMFLSSPQGHFEATVAAIRSLSDEDLTWDDVTSRLIEEASSPRSRTRQDSAFVVNSRPMCTFCGRQGHDANRCFTNPANPNNRLGNSTLQPPSLRSGPHRRSAMVHSMDSNAPVSRRLPSPKTFPSLRLQHLPQSSHRRERDAGEAPVPTSSSSPARLLPSCLVLHPHSRVPSSSILGRALICVLTASGLRTFALVPQAISSLGTTLPSCAKRREPFSLQFTQVHVRTLFCSLIPSTLPRCVIRSFLAARSLHRPCTPIFQAPRAPSTMLPLHHRRSWSLVVPNAMVFTS